MRLDSSVRLAYVCSSTVPGSNGLRLRRRCTRACSRCSCRSGISACLPACLLRGRRSCDCDAVMDIGNTCMEAPTDSFVCRNISQLYILRLDVPCGSRDRRARLSRPVAGRSSDACSDVGARETPGAGTRRAARCARASPSGSLGLSGARPCRVLCHMRFESCDLTFQTMGQYSGSIYEEAVYITIGRPQA